MKKILGLFFGLILSVPAFATIPADYVPIYPDNTTLYPETLSGYTKLVVDGTYNWEDVASGQSLYFRYRLGAGRKYESGNPQISDWYTTTAMGSSTVGKGFSVYYSSSASGTFIGVRDVDIFTTADAVRTYFTNNPMTVLYKSTTATDNEFRAVRRVRDGVLGYYCESGTNAGDFVVAYGMTGSICMAGQRLETYTSATGTFTQNPAPTPNAPVYPTFYTQGDLTLRAVGSGDNIIADSYDATTGKITRRVGVMIIDDTINWSIVGSPNPYFRTYVSTPNGGGRQLYSHFPYASIAQANTNQGMSYGYSSGARSYVIDIRYTDLFPVNSDNISLLKQWLSQNPVTIWYSLREEDYYEENWAPEQCINPIKIATTKYNTNAFQPVLTALNNAVDTIKDVVANTITQATAVANLQTGKQQRPNPTDTNGTCPNYRQCLLVEDESGTPHWYEIMDPFYNLFSAVIPNNVSTDSVTSQNGVPSNYTQLEYIESNNSGIQYIDTGVSPVMDKTTVVELVAQGTGDRGWPFSFDQDWSGTGIGDLGTKWYAMGFSGTVSSLQKTTLIATFFNEGSSRKFMANIGGITGNVSTHSRNYYTFYMFQTRGWSEPNGVWYGKIYSFKIRQNDVLLRDFVPVRSNSDQRVGMYDLVRGVFYPNQGTGSFIAGPEVQNQQALWTMGFGANAPLDARYMVNGSAVCNATLGAANTAATSAQMSNANWTATGNNCWCSIDMVTELNNNNISTGKNIWVWLEVPSGETCAVDCASNCADAMASGAAADKPFRQAMTGM